MKTSSMVLACLLLTGACSKVKELDKRTQNTEKSTERISKVTDDLKEMTTIMAQQNAEEGRDENFQVLMNKEADKGARLNAAESYVKSVEAQISKIDDGDARENAAKEFTHRMNDLYSKINTRKMSPLKDSNKFEVSFYAIAASLNENSKQTSFYGLITEALRKEYQRDRLLVHEEVLVNGINKEIMIELIKARVDITSGMALKNLTDDRELTLGQKTKAMIFKITGGRLGSIDLPETYDKSNEATRNITEKYLKSSVKSRHFLNEIEVNKDLEKTMKSAFSKIDFNEDSSEEKFQPDQKKEQIRSLINDLLK